MSFTASYWLISAAGVALLLASPQAQVATVRFENVAAQAGLTRSFPNGGDVTKEFIIETTGSGVGFIDYDNDGLLDIFIASGPGESSRLYHNEGNGHFKDVTEAMGLKQSGWAQGVCAGDYDNDGFTDLFVTYWGGNHLYRNIGGRRFEDVTERAHLTQDRVRYNTGCAFLDYDKDGHLDLFVANYLQFDPKTTPKPGANPYCYYRDIPVNCGPRGLPFDRNILYHSNGDGTFTDVSVASGIAAPDRNYSLGVLTGDFNNDGLPDIYVSCDQTPSLLYINQGNGKFEEEALLRGVAYDANGKAMSGMGATAADVRQKGVLDIFRTNFSDERETLYRSLDAEGNFEDATIVAGMSRNTRFVSWGCGFFDFDNDGWKDLLLVNGHVFPEVDRLKLDIHYKDRAILYHNLGNGKFEDISESAGPGILERHSSRGAAFGDYDNDGRVEVLVNNQNDPPSLLKQTLPIANHWIILKLTGTRSNRSAIGARVKLIVNGHPQLDEVRSGGGYLSQNDLRLHFGVGPATQIDQVQIDWPSGVHQVERNLPVDRVLALTEPDSHSKASLLERLEAARLWSPVRPSIARHLFDECLLEAEQKPPSDPALITQLVETGLRVDPDSRMRIVKIAQDPRIAHDAIIGYYVGQGDTEAAIHAARNAGQAGFPALASTHRLLLQLYSENPHEAVALFSELLADLPPALSDLELRFLCAHLRPLARIDPSIAVQTAERILRETKLADPYRFTAGAYLAVFDRAKFNRLEELFADSRDRLITLAASDLDAVSAALPPPIWEATPAPQTALTKAGGQLAAGIQAESEQVLPLRSHRGQVTVVQFWATWCPPCRRELPLLEEFSRKYRRQGLSVLGVSAEPDPLAARFFASYGITFTNLTDESRRTHLQFEVASLPVTLIFDRQGHPVSRLTGEQTPEGLARAIQSVLLQ